MISNYIQLNNLTTKEINQQNALRTIIALRKTKDIKQLEVAQYLNLDTRTISAFEKRFGELDHEFIKKYTEAVEALLELKNGGQDE